MFLFKRCRKILNKEIGKKSPGLGFKTVEKCKLFTRVSSNYEPAIPFPTLKFKILLQKQKQQPNKSNKIKRN